MVLAEIALRRGDYNQARDYAFQLKSHSETHQFPVTEAIADTILARAYYELGSVEKANASCENALNTSRALRLPEVEIRALSLDALINPSLDKGERVMSLILQALDESQIPLAWRLFNDLAEQLSDENRLKCQTRIPGVPQTYHVAVIDCGLRRVTTLANSRQATKALK
jgi:tetratricopeptide (TPR) repeat protein